MISGQLGISSAQPPSDRAMRRKTVVGFLSWALEPGKGDSRPSLGLWEIHCQMSFSIVFLSKAHGLLFCKDLPSACSREEKGCPLSWTRWRILPRKQCCIDTCGHRESRLQTEDFHRCCGNSTSWLPDNIV